MASEATGIMPEIEARTIQYAGAWGANHARRLIMLVERIAAGGAYEEAVLRIAAYMHDWGGYEPWKKAGVDHAVRSAEVIPGVLTELGMPGESAALAAECARLHHSCDAKAAFEAILLHDADAIDFLGITGLLRNCSMKSRDLRGAFEKTKARMDYARARLILDGSRTIAEPLFPRMERVLEEFERETGGLF